MAKELDIQRESLTYTARFAKPLFNLWGRGGAIVEALYEALAPYGVTLGNIVISANVVNAAEPVITVWVRGSSTVKFAFDRVEFALHDFTQDFFEALPKLFKDSLGWVKTEAPKVRFASHNFGYYCHGPVKDSTTKAFLETINPKMLKSAGVSRGNATIFNNSVSDKNWTTRIWFDHSQLIPGALFVALIIDTVTEELDYPATLVDGRTYLRSVLSEVDLALPELSQ